MTVRLLLLVRNHLLPRIITRTATCLGLGLSCLSLHQPQLHLHLRAHRIRKHLHWECRVLDLPRVVLLLLLVMLERLGVSTHLHLPG